MKKTKRLWPHKISILFIAVVSFTYVDSVMAAWTSPPAKVKQFYSTSNNVAWIQLDTSVTVSNPAGCVIHNNWFKVTNLDSTQGKTGWSVVMTAYAMDHKITINSSVCDTGGNYNTVNYIRLNAEQN